MSADEKDNYKTLANKLNQKDENKQLSPKNKGVEQIINLHNDSSEYWIMKDYLKNMFQCIPNQEGKNN